jgi:hypothetical protein
MMNDDLITLVREQRSKVPMTTPVEEIIGRGRAVRARRRMAGLTGVLAGAAVAVAAVIPFGHQAPRPPAAQLAAWTVTRHAGGDIEVTIHELRDPAGLQASLRADGVPANVSFAPSGLPSACQPYTPSPSLLASLLGMIIQMHPGQSAVLVIDPSAIPSGVGLAIDVFPVSVNGQLDRAGIGTGTSLVYASEQCTGS